MWGWVLYVPRLRQLLWCSAPCWHCPLNPILHKHMAFGCRNSIPLIWLYVLVENILLNTVMGCCNPMLLIKQIIKFVFATPQSDTTQTSFACRDPPVFAGFAYPLNNNHADVCYKLHQRGLYTVPAALAVLEVIWLWVMSCFNPLNVCVSSTQRNAGLIYSSSCPRSSWSNLVMSHELL